MKSIRPLVLLACFAALPLLPFSGCSSPAASMDVTALDYDREPSDYEGPAFEYFKYKLKDPDSAKIEVREKLGKIYTRNAPATGGKISVCGWGAIVLVNAKNGFGGYSGWQEHRLLYRSNRVVDEFSVNPWFSEPWFK